MKESLHRDTLQARWEVFSAGEWDPTRRWNKRAPGELKNVDIIKTANLKMWILLKPFAAAHHDLSLSAKVRPTKKSLVNKKVDLCSPWDVRAHPSYPHSLRACTTFDISRLFERRDKRPFLLCDIFVLYGICCLPSDFRVA